MKTLYDMNAPRRAVNLSLNGELVEKARAERLNLSAIAEQAIGRALAEAARKRFDEEIARGVAQHTEYLATYGSIGDAIRAMNTRDGD
jgi:antitoxin CcdA